VGKLAEILNDKRPGRKVTAMFLDMAFGSPIYEPGGTISGILYAKDVAGSESPAGPLARHDLEDV
jgi:hypothetical protein